MPRTARIVVPGLAHHVVQRGNRQQRIFFTRGDCHRYIEMLVDSCRLQEVRCLAWCLMPNHVHLILIPPAADSLRKVMSSVHTRYAQRINRRDGLSGHLFQDRFRSEPLDDAHLIAAVRYVENNPVKAGVATSAEHWEWSSARTHVGLANDPLTDIGMLEPHLPNWRAYLRQGAEAAESETMGTVPRDKGLSPSLTTTPLARPFGGSPGSPPVTLSSPG